jgi:Fe-S-cluster containining protein
MEKAITKADRDFFVVMLKEEAREALWKVGSSTDPQTLIDGIKEDLEALAPRTDGTENRSDEEIWMQVRERLINAAYATRQYCIRCGACCEQGSPTLTRNDLDGFRANVLKPEHLVTIRQGEPTYDSRTEKIGPAEREMLKVRERAGSRTCILYDKTSLERECGCSIYESRPDQCRRQECWNPDSSRAADAVPLTRKDLLTGLGELWEVIERHEERCSYEELNRCMARLTATKGQTIDEIVDVLSFDQHVRDFLHKRLGLPLEAMELFLGRPMRDAIDAYGLRVEDKPDGTFLVTLVEGGVGEK